MKKILILALMFPLLAVGQSPIFMSRRTVSSNYSVRTTDAYLAVVVACTNSLPAASAVRSGQTFWIHDVNGFTVTVRPAGGDDVNGSGSDVIVNNFLTGIFVSNGVDGWEGTFSASNPLRTFDPGQFLTSVDSVSLEGATTNAVGAAVSFVGTDTSPVIFQTTNTLNQTITLAGFPSLSGREKKWLIRVTSPAGLTTLALSGLSLTTRSGTFLNPPPTGLNEYLIEGIDGVYYLDVLRFGFATSQRTFGRNSAGAGDAELVTMPQQMDWLGTGVAGMVPQYSSAGWTNRLIRFTPSITPTQITSNQNDYNPANLSTAMRLALSTDAARTITGIQTDGTDGRTLMLWNAGSFNITLTDSDVLSATTNRFVLPRSLPVTIVPGEGLVVLWSAFNNKWRTFTKPAVFIGDSGAGGTTGLVPAPAAGDAAASKFLKADGTWAVGGGGGGGDFVGPASSTDNAILRFDGATGKLGQNSIWTLDDTGNLTAGDASAASSSLLWNFSGSNDPLWLLSDGSFIQTNAPVFAIASATATIRLGLTGGAAFTFENANTIALGEAGASPGNQTLKAANTTGSNKASTRLIIATGKGTGTGSPEYLELQTAVRGTSSGSSGNNLGARAHFGGNSLALTESVATALTTITLATNTSASYVVMALTRADDGTDYQARTDSFQVDAVNKNGTVTTTLTITTSSAQATAGTLATTWTATASGNNVVLNNNAVSSLTQTTLASKFLAFVNSNDVATFTDN